MAALEGQLGQSKGQGPKAGGAAANRWLVLAIVLAAVFMQLLDTTVAASPAPAAVKATVAAAVQYQAIPLALKDDFTRSLQRTLLLWQVAAFTLCGLLVLALPKVRPSATIPGAA